MHSQGNSWEIINKSVSRRGISSSGARYIKLNSDSRLSLYETLKKRFSEGTVHLYFLKFTYLRFKNRLNSRRYKMQIKKWSIKLQNKCGSFPDEISYK